MRPMMTFVRIIYSVVFVRQNGENSNWKKTPPFFEMDMRDHHYISRDIKKKKKRERERVKGEGELVEYSI